METKKVPSEFLKLLGSSHEQENWENLKKVLPLSIFNRIRLRMMSAEDWIEEHASGTLRKNKRIGMAWKKQYWHERICWEFGYTFEMLPRTRVVYNDANTEEDCSPITEAGWFIERYKNFSIFSEDHFEVKYLIVEEQDGTRREGIGIIVKQTSFNLPEGNIIFAIVTEFDLVKKEFKDARNPF
jgi:hypothetical protein